MSSLSFSSDAHIRPSLRLDILQAHSDHSSIPFRSMVLFPIVMMGGHLVSKPDEMDFDGAWAGLFGAGAG
ncbi:hypothetical protein [Rubritalea tangerina]|uniref:hypothetical protein n=1 Tax=Rubritalea tangerina TaxID=430798 RepID=UPI00360BC842